MKNNPGAALNGSTITNWSLNRAGSSMTLHGIDKTTRTAVHIPHITHVGVAHGKRQGYAMAMHRDGRTFWLSFTV